MTGAVNVRSRAATMSIPIAFDACVTMISSFVFGEFPECPFKIAEGGLLFNLPKNGILVSFSNGHFHLESGSHS
jgi:hypothetical protein